MLEAFANQPVVVMANGPLLFTGVKNQIGRTTRVYNGSIALIHPGVYKIITNVSYLATGAGLVTVTASVDGTPSNVAIGTATAAAGDTVNITIPMLVTVEDGACDCGNYVTVSYNVNAEGTLMNMNSVVTKEQTS